MICLGHGCYLNGMRKPSNSHWHKLRPHPHRPIPRRKPTSMFSSLFGRLQNCDKKSPPVVFTHWIARFSFLLLEFCPLVYRYHYTAHVCTTCMVLRRSSRFQLWRACWTRRASAVSPRNCRIFPRNLQRSTHLLTQGEMRSSHERCHTYVFGKSCKTMSIMCCRDTWQTTSVSKWIKRPL